MLGQIHYCLQEEVPYDPGEAFANAGAGAATPAAA